jgi:hypothetical protein
VVNRHHVRPALLDEGGEGGGIDPVVGGEVAAAAVHHPEASVRKGSKYLSARYHRIKSRRGHARATIATSHKILTAAYHVLQRGVPYNELGEEFFYGLEPLPEAA